MAILATLLTTRGASQIMLGGDLMLNRAQPGPKVLSELAPYLHSADAAFANLEIPLTTANTPTTRKSAEEVRRRDQYILRASPLHAPFLSEAGISAVSLGNNHCMDYGQAGLDEMRTALRSAGIGLAGAGDDLAEASKVQVVTLPSGARVGLLSAMAFMTPRALDKTTPATETSAGVNTLSFGGIIDSSAQEALLAWIQAARKECDYVVVGVHWGVERMTVPNVYQVQLGRALADAGADVVWGNHPHVLQGAEIYHGVPILYSMGNLLASLPGPTGLVRINFGPYLRFEFIPAYVRDNRCVPLIGLPAESAKRVYRALCAAIQAKYPSRDSVAPEF